MSKRIKISAVSYANSYPFIYGLRNHPVFESVELELDTPSDCAKKLACGEVGLGLVPVAIIPELDNPQIISNYCIGADGPVESVCLFSDVPINKIESVLLDYQSRTSVQLVQYLAQKKWRISPEWINGEDGFEKNIKGTTAGVVIGDRAFPLLEKFKYVMDLSSEWKEQTSLPFVFACWVSNKELEIEFVDAFNEALAEGLSNKEKSIAEMADANHTDLVRYVKSVIRYNLDEKKRQAMKLFLDWMSKQK